MKKTPPVTIMSSPGISGISPVSGTAGITVTITGANFGANPSGNTVNFNGIAATVSSASASSLITTAPPTITAISPVAGAAGTTGAVTITTADGTATGPSFTYTAGTDVYVPGYYLNTAKYWKNGTMVDPTSTVPGPLTFEFATGIAGIGSDIYICGNDVSKGYGYWKNAVFTSLQSASIINGIFVK